MTSKTHTADSGQMYVLVERKNETRLNGVISAGIVTTYGFCGVWLRIVDDKYCDLAFVCERSRDGRERRTRKLMHILFCCTVMIWAQHVVDASNIPKFGQIILCAKTRYAKSKRKLIQHECFIFTIYDINNWKKNQILHWVRVTKSLRNMV